MNIERLKNIVLTLLLISSLVLTGQIWFNEKLWPEGYNFFVSVQASPIGQAFKWLAPAEQTQHNTEQQLIYPHHLVAYTVRDFDHVSLELTAEHKYFPSVDQFIRDAIRQAFAGDSKLMTKITENDWQKALFTRGLYVDYGESYVAATFADILGVSPAISFPVKQVKDFIVVPGDNLSDNVVVFIKDDADASFYKIPTDTLKSDLETLLNNLAEDATPRNRFSFFIETDIQKGVEAVFDPYILLREEGSVLPVIRGSNPFMRADGTLNLSSYAAERVLELFSINPRTARRYIGADESILYVQNQSTLKMNPLGTIEYTTVSDGRVFPLTDDFTQSTTAASLSAVMDIANGINSAGEQRTEGLDFYLSSLTENENGFVVTLDYLYQGIPVVFSDALENSHAVYAEVENGYLKSYRHIVRTYQSVNSNAMVLDSVGAADEVFLDNPISKIEDMFIGYADNGEDSEKKPGWFVKLENMEGYKS